MSISPRSCRVIQFAYSLSARGDPLAASVGELEIEVRMSKVVYLESLNAHRGAQHAITVALTSAVARAEAAASEALCGRN